MKLPHKKSEAPGAPNWHPDFRDVAALPDLKVVRTSFFVNLVCITVASIVVMFSAYREYVALELRAAIGDAEQAMETAQAQNDQLLALNREFNESIRRFNEAEKFAQSPFLASELIIALSRSLPANMDFTSVSYDNGNLSLRGGIRGASETASTRVSAYLDVLRSDKIIGPLFPDVSLVSLPRDPRTQGLSFEIVLKPTTGKPAVKSPSA